MSDALESVLERELLAIVDSVVARVDVMVRVLKGRLDCEARLQEKRQRKALGGRVGWAVDGPRALFVRGPSTSSTCTPETQK